jgi:hypothetical protein
VYTEGIWAFADFESSKRCPSPMRVVPLGISQITPMQTEAFLSKNRGFLTGLKNRRILKNMITGIKKSHKTTEIYFDEADEWTTVRTYNTSLKNRLLAFSKEYPELCELTDDDECGCLSFRIQKKYFTYRISAPYTEERKATARAKMNEVNAKK